MATYEKYTRSQADKIYDEMRGRKIYMGKGMDCYTEWIEGVPMVRRALIAKADSTKMTLDEWANEFNVSCSRLIELLGQAFYVWERQEATRQEMQAMRAYYEGAVA